MASRSLKESLPTLRLCTRGGITLSELPAGGIGVAARSTAENGQSQSMGSTDLEQFLKEVLAEAVPFVDGIAPKSGVPSTWKVKGSPKTYAESAASVYSAEKSVSVLSSKTRGTSEKGRTETWFSRRSCHKNIAAKGTASWEEFDRAFRTRHAETEKEFVPTVISVRRAINWNSEGIEIELNGERWIDFVFEVWEMKHRIDPKPLHNRTFTTLQITTRIEGVNEFIMIQIPISDSAKSSYFEYARDKDLVVGSYTAVERVRLVPDSGEIEWIMATASDAGGVLPQFVQDLAVPGEIAKDVPKFLGWIQTQR